MAPRPYATIVRCVFVMLVKASATVVVALCSASRHLRLMRTVLKLLRIHIAAENDVLFKNKVKTELHLELNKIKKKKTTSKTY